MRKVIRGSNQTQTDRILSSSLIFALVGLVCGYLSSAPIGPINLWIAHKATLRHSFSELSWFIGGVIAADLILAGAAIWGYFHFLQNPDFHKWIGFLGGPLCISLGGALIFQNFRRNEDPNDANHEPLKRFTRFDGMTKARQFLGGAGLCLVNPAFFAFWVVVLNAISSKINQSPDGISAFLFLLFIGIGDALWFATLIKLVKKGVNLVRPRVVKRIRYVIGFLFIGFGLIVITQQLT